MRITFVLPNPIRIPRGGAKVVYRHAAGLVARGHQVCVVAPKQSGTGPLAMARRVAVAARDALHGVAGEQAYSASGVETIDIPSPSPRFVPDGDIVIATGVQTAPWVASLPASKGRAVYFVQGDETFVRPDARDSWHLGMGLITVAEWLAAEMQSAGLQPLGIAPNAVDPDEFGLDVEIGTREPSIVALYHRHPVKGPDVLIDSIAHVQLQMPQVRIDLFSARPPSHSIPNGVHVQVRPAPEALRALYNRAAVLLHPSRSESMPLVPMEAAACGCAIIASDNPGVHEYLSAGESMVTASVGDGVALGAAALRVLQDDLWRQRLAHAGHQAVRSLDWNRSTDSFEAALGRAIS